MMEMPGSDEWFMRQAMKESRKALVKGEVPVGAIVVKDGRVIGRGWNQVETLKDATAHAEMIALTAAQEALGDWRLGGRTPYVTQEAGPPGRFFLGGAACGVLPASLRPATVW